MSDFFKVINFDNVKGAVRPSKYRNNHKDLIQHPASVLIVAKSGMGKTNLLMNILTKWSCWVRSLNAVKRRRLCLIERPSIVEQILQRAFVGLIL